MEKASDKGVIRAWHGCLPNLLRGMHTNFSGSRDKFFIMIYSRFSLSSLLRTVVCLTLLAGLLDLNAARSIAQQDGDIDTVKVDSSLVRLNVGVVDAKGRAIVNLSRNDFSVYEDNVQQKVLSFEPSTSPFSLVLLLDMSSSTQGFRQPLKLSAFRFLDALSPNDRVAVVAFKENSELLSDFTSDRRKMGYAIDIAQGKGKTELFKALGFALEKLSHEGQRRKAIVVLTDGMDIPMMNADRTASAAAETNEAAIASVKPETSPPMNSVLNLADRMGVTIYPLALPSGDPKHIPYPTPQQIAIYTSARARLQVLADRTGGRLSAINRLEDMGRIYKEVAADMQTLYSVVYQSSNERVRDGKWRAIRVEVAQPELLARTRPGYFAR
jgi:VWFA-related protein